MDKSLLRRLDSPLVPFLITTIVVSLFTFGMLLRSGFDASSFVTAGDKYCDPSLVPKNLTVLKSSAGYDGQFYYRLALDPFTSKRTDFGITLDIPSFRHQRILYPFLSWALSAGNAGLLPWIMLLINYAALCLLGWLGGVYAQTLKQHALWGIFLPLIPAALLSLTRDLVELLEVSLLLSSLLLLRRGKQFWGAILLTLAALTKESALLVAGAAMLSQVAGRRGEKKEPIHWHYFTLPIVTFLIWQMALLINWQELPFLAGKMNIGVPFSGFISFFLDASNLQTPLQRRSFPELMLLIAFAFGVIYHIRSSAASFHEALSWFFYGALALSYSRVIWIEDWAYLRAVSEFCVLGMIIVIGAGSRAKAMILGSFSILWLFIFLRLLRHGD
ncbi:MAG TPA: hypothetical protein VJ810_08960 [Blastocatellia bacterium]|nr:hypothetical protein [Blastocatellia bacterium]